MASFKEEIEKKRESHAYCQGIDAFHAGYDKKMVRSPYELDSKADKEWLDGFYDAWYIRMITRGQDGIRN